jgi:hypothetical protein
MKKTVLALAFAFSASAMAANPVANVIWSGFVPGSVAGDNLIITGLAGQAIANGQLIVATDGTFDSTSVTVESHTYTPGVAGAPGTTGALADANWTLSSSQVSYSGVSAVGADLVVKADGAPWTVGSLQSAKNTLNLSVAQNAPIEVGAGGSVQAQVTLVAEKV